MCRARVRACRRSRRATTPMLRRGAQLAGGLLAATTAGMRRTHHPWFPKPNAARRRPQPRCTFQGRSNLLSPKHTQYSAADAVYRNYLIRFIGTGAKLGRRMLYGGGIRGRWDLHPECLGRYGMFKANGCRWVGAGACF